MTFISIFACLARLNTDIKLNLIEHSGIIIINLHACFLKVTKNVFILQHQRGLQCEIKIERRENTSKNC